MNKILEDELDVLLNSNLPLEKYRNKTFLITGATGLIGSLLTKALLFLNKSEKLNLTVIAGIRDQEKANRIFNDVKDQQALQFMPIVLGKGELNCDYHIDFIIHTASITASKTMISDPVGTIRTAVNGTEEILNLAINKKIKGMVYVSSMEVYGQINTVSKVTEEQLGTIDLSKIRSCYPESKRLCELLCTSYAVQYNLNVKNARLAQTFGVGVLPSENRVFAQFARSVMRGEDIILHTEGRSEGNYVYTIDAICALLLLVTEGTAGESYNVSNLRSHVTIRQMAELVASKIAGGAIHVRVELPNNDLGYAPDVRLWMDNQKLCALGWTPKVGLEESYRRMIKWMRQDIL